MLDNKRKIKLYEDFIEDIADVRGAFYWDPCEKFELLRIAITLQEEIRKIEEGE